MALVNQPCEYVSVGVRARFTFVLLLSGRDHRQHLQQHREPGTHPADGPGLHGLGRAAH